MIADESDDKDMQVEPIKNLNLHRLKISIYIPLDIKSRLEALWNKTSQQ